MVAKQESTGAPILDAQFLAEDQVILCGLDRMVQVWNLTSNVLTPLGVVSWSFSSFSALAPCLARPDARMSVTWSVLLSAHRIPPLLAARRRSA
jgi:hypothetical protein